jgi:hypothetical protein
MKKKKVETYDYVEYPDDYDSSHIAVVGRDVSGKPATMCPESKEPRTLSLSDCMNARIQCMIMNLKVNGKRKNFLIYNTIWKEMKILVKTTL